MKGQRSISPTVSAQYVRDGLWPNTTLLDFFDEAVKKAPSKTAIVAPGGVRLTYKELAEAVDVTARGLKAAGLGPGDILSIQLPNCAEVAILHVAATKLGAVTIPLLPNYRANELAYILGFAKTKVAIIPQSYRRFDYPEMYQQIWPALPDLGNIFVLGGNGAGAMRPYRDLLAIGRESSTALPSVVATGDDLTTLIFTSGTESKPKGVMHSHNTTLHGTIQMGRLLGLGSDDVVWVPSPVGHGTGFQWGIRQAITLGSTMVLQDLWDVEEALRLIEAERCSFVLSATPFVAMLLESPSLDRRDLSSFRIFACAGAPIPRALGEKARSKIGCTLIGMWGMSECFVGSASPPDAPVEKLWETDGRAVAGAELAIFDETRTRRLAPGEIGELATRGPHVALGYFNDPERTASTFSDEGWLFSNDVATIDTEGYIRLGGRKKDIINRGGLKVSTREIEEFLLQHPAILSVAVVPMKDDRLGEKGCACVVLREGMKIDLPTITKFLETRGLAKYKMPEYIALMDELPMTPSGKVQKFRLEQGLSDKTIGVSTN